MLTQDISANSEPEPHTFRFCRLKRLKKLLAHFRGNARSVVGNVETHASVHISRTDVHLLFAILVFEGLKSIYDKIDKHLANSAAVSMDIVECSSDIDVQSDIHLAGSILKKIDRLFHNGVKANCFQLMRTRIG